MRDKNKYGVSQKIQEAYRKTNTSKNIREAYKEMQKGVLSSWLPPTHTWETVDKKKAEEFLKENRGNRTVDKNRVKTYAKLMNEGAFQDFSPDSICFDTTGKLINCQHRLLAIVQTDTSYVMGVQRGLAPSAANIIDQAKTRTVTDLLDIKSGTQSFKYKNQVASDAKRIQKGFGTNTHLQPSNDDISEFALKNKDVMYEFYKIFVATSKYSVATIRGAFIGFAILYPDRRADVIEWARQLVDNTIGYDKHDPLNLFVKKFDELQRKKAKDKETTIPTRVYYSYALGTVQAKLDGKPIRKLKPLDLCPFTHTVMNLTTTDKGENYGKSKEKVEL